MCKAIAWGVCLAFLLSGTAPVSAEPLSQKLYPDNPNTCGPCSLLYSLRESGHAQQQLALDSLRADDSAGQLQKLVDQWFRTRRSKVFPQLTRLQHDGVWAEDLAATWQDLLERADEEQPTANISAHRLLRQEGESTDDLFRRVDRTIRGSLAQGVLPIIGLQHLYVERLPDGTFWRRGSQHFVCVIEREPVDDIGLALTVFDPADGELRRILVQETASPVAFRAPAATGPQARWVGGRPYLTVQADSVFALRQGELRWDERSIVILQTAIGLK